MVIKISTLIELLIPEAFNIGNSILDRIYLSSVRFKTKLAKLQSISGGYFPYAHALWNTWNTRSNIVLSEDLISATLRLFSSLTKSQVDILKSIVLKQNFNAGNDLNYLIVASLVIKEGSGFSVFSPILTSYFRSTNQPEN